MSTRTVDLSVRCPRCRMRLDGCLCPEIPRLETRTRIVFLMHWRETWTTTNTARLATLALPNAEIRVRGAKDKPLSWDGVFSPEREPLFLYPDEGAAMLDASFAASLARPVTLIVPDGTWRQAGRVGKREPALAGVRRVKLPPGRSSYLLRRPREACLSTMEAVAAALGILESPELERELTALFGLMVSRTLATRSPPSIRARLSFSS